MGGFGAISGGAGGISSSSSADGDESFDNGGFSYKTNADDGQGVLIIAGLIVLALLLGSKK